MPYWSNYFGETSLLADGVSPIHIDLIPVVSFDPTPENTDALLTEVDTSSWYVKSVTKYNPENRPSTPRSFSIEDKKKHLDKFQNKFLREFHSEPKEDSFLTYSFHDALVKKSRPYYTNNQIFPLTTVKFEGYDLPAPKEAIEYIKVLYGDNYMTLPPPEKRTSQEYKYLKNSGSKKKTKIKLNLFLENDYHYFRARLFKSRAKQFMYKIVLYVILAKKSIVAGVPFFPLRKMRHTYFKVVKMYTKK